MFGYHYYELVLVNRDFLLMAAWIFPYECSLDYYCYEECLFIRYIKHQNALCFKRQTCNSIIE